MRIVSRVRFFLLLVAGLGCAGTLVFSAFQPQKVILTPTDNDLVVLNGCVISACNYLAVLETQHGLEKNFWAKILLVSYKDHPAGNAYCVWDTAGTVAVAIETPKSPVGRYMSLNA